jgi:1-deoxy-D-xylulose-5-phosphate reductoisomerase
MKKKIIILGSTGSIGKKTFDLIKKKKNIFNLILLSTNKNIRLLIKQAKVFRVKHLIITNKLMFEYAKKKFKRNKYLFYNNFFELENILAKNKIFYSMNSIVGLDGLIPTIKLIKYSKNIAIVNKESLICGWNIINKELKKYKTNFIPIDSEHFSINELIKNKNIKTIDKIYITASGGPFLNLKKKLSNVTIKDALNHPNWSMGKKISIDSATMMNKVFEVIEAKNIFDLDYNKIDILIHPSSYVHSIVKLNNGQIRFLAHEPNMSIPIYNSISNDNLRGLKTKNINLKILNNLNFNKINSLFETALVTINDYFVEMFLNKQISFKKLISLICKYSTHKDFIKYKKISARSIKEISKTRDYVCFKLSNISI